MAYDTLLGRRWNVDPVTKPWESSYATFANNPIWFRDIDGKDTVFGNDNQARQDFITALDKVNSSISQLELKIQGYKDRLSREILKKRQIRKIEKLKANSERELEEWYKLKRDFVNIIKSKVRFHYTSDTKDLEEDESGKITGGTTYGSGEDMTGDVYISIRPGNDSYVIHEDRHANQILNNTKNRPVLVREREAYLYQKIYAPTEIENLINKAKQEQYPNPSDRPEFYDLDNAIKYMYREEIDSEKQQ